jgi:hypothetical protein
VPLLEDCMPAFLIVADAGKDADVRSSLLVLLDFLLSESGIQQHMHRFGAMLLADVLVPLCVWRAGKVRATRFTACRLVDGVPMHPHMHPHNARKHTHTHFDVAGCTSPAQGRDGVHAAAVLAAPLQG